jgi:dihydrofolate synthase/folylpolyglutamate synthase
VGNRAQAPGERVSPADAGTVARLREVEREIFARRPEHDIKPSLDRIAALVTLLGDPHRGCPVIHITGTNGKTSTARMAEALLRARGLRTGLFTSPHLTSVAERICIDGEPLAPAAFLAAWDDVAPYVAMVDEREAARLSFFEVLTAMAFAAFADAPVDVAVIEVGLGGTWDATNVADGQVAVVTPISIDHTAYLGTTVSQIATEKAGIIKPGAIAVLAGQPQQAADVLLRRAAQVGAAVAREGAEFGVLARELAVGGQRVTLRGLGGDYHDLLLPLFGEHQAGNAACALAAVEAFAGVDLTLAGGNGYAQAAAMLDEDLVREAFAGASSPGRLEVVRRSPTVVVDAAHNPAGMAVSLAALGEAFPFAHLIAVLAVSADKDVTGILAELEPVADQLVVTQNSSARSLAAADLARLAVPLFGPDRVKSADRVDEAIELAVALADDIGMDAPPGSVGVLVTGSVVTAGDARILLAAPPGGRGDSGYGED